jgi:RNA polymerase sigma-70 factor (ECF subfamily)
MNSADFEAFYNRTAPRVRAYLVRAVGQRALADDLLQEACLRFLRSGFEGDDEQHRRRYLFTIASNLVKDHYRSRASTEQQLCGHERGEQSSLDQRRAEQTSGLRHDLGRAMAKLPLRDRQLLWLAHVEEFSHRELAKVFGLTEGSSRVAVLKARRRLLEIVAPSGSRSAEAPGKKILCKTEPSHEAC